MMEINKDTDFHLNPYNGMIVIEKSFSLLLPIFGSFDLFFPISVIL
ncbi:hypothetical protein RKD55_000935 [Rossellomorea marisflavi]